MCALEISKIMCALAFSILPL